MKFKNIFVMIAALFVCTSVKPEDTYGKEILSKEHVLKYLINNETALKKANPLFFYDSLKYLQSDAELPQKYLSDTQFFIEWCIGKHDKSYVEIALGYLISLPTAQKDAYVFGYATKENAYNLAAKAAVVGAVYGAYKLYQKLSEKMKEVDTHTPEKLQPAPVRYV